MISLKTTDRAEAKIRCAEMAVEVDRQMEALRSGPKPLTQKQIVALCGHTYKSFTQILENNPGEPETWAAVEQANRETIRGIAIPNPLMIGEPSDLTKYALEQRFGGLADALLRHFKLVTDEASRERLTQALARDMTEAASKLRRNAEGDYSPDTYVNRFPEIESTADKSKPHQTLSGLADAWHDAALPRGVTPRDAGRWKRVMYRFIDWIGHDDLPRVKARDVQRWGDERNASGISAKTINDTDFAALRAIFEWGKGRGYLEVNPAEKAKILSKGKASVRERYFLPHEIKAILNAASAVQGSLKESPTTTAAKKWVPWLCAYSGARVAELIQLRREDFRSDDDGTLIMRLNPTAGSIKTNEYRDVPIHRHLLALGLPELLTKAGSGYLFCKPGKDGTIAGPAEGVYKRIRDATRAVVSDPDVQPNHAWRYTFKTRGYDANLDRLALDAICGHAPSTKGDDYTRVTLQKKKQVMAAFPPYDLT